MKRRLLVFLTAAVCLLALAYDPAAAFEQGRWDSRRFTDIANDTTPDLGGNLNTAGFYVYCDGVGPVYVNDNLRVTGTITVDDSAAACPLNLTERATAPTSPAAGDIYLDTGANTTSGRPGFRRYTGAAWEDVDAVGPAAETDPIVGAITGIVKANGAGVISAAADGTDYLAPTRIDDTKGNGDTAYTWSSDKIYDQLALKQDASTYDTIWLPASAWRATSTNGATFATEEKATNDQNYEYWLFPGDVEKYIETDVVMPENWDRGTFKAKAYFYPASGCSAGDTVEWEIGCVAVSNDDALDVALGTAQVISDTILAGVDGDLHVTGATPAITVGGTPALGDLIHCKASRNVSGTDDMTEQAKFIGALIQITLNNSVAAW